MTDELDDDEPTVEPFTVDVPLAVPGELITAAWGNQVRTDLTELWTSLNGLNVQVAPGASGTSGGGLPNIQSLTVPAKATGGIIVAHSYCRVDFATGSAYEIQLRSGTTILSRRVFGSAQLASAASPWYLMLVGVTGTTQGVSTNLNLHGTGTANITTFADYTVNQLTAIFVPTTT